MSEKEKKNQKRTINEQAQQSLKNLKEYFTFLVDNDFDFVASDHTQRTSEQLDIIGLALDKANKLQEDKDYIINQYERLTRYRKQLHEADLGETLMLEKQYEMLYQTVQDIEELIQKEMEKQYE